MYQVKFYKGEYRARQNAANQDGAVAYVEHHFNASQSPSADYSLVIVGANASQTSRNWGRWYAAAIAREFNTKVGGDQGIVVGGFNGRGDGNVRHTRMPALLLEPLFVSNPRHAGIVKSLDGQARLAGVLVDSIQRFFPDGGLIAFSVGHKYKPSKPGDMGASVVGGGAEAEFAEAVLERAKQSLENIGAVESERRIRVLKGDTELFSQAIDDDAELVWDPVRGILRIIE